MMMIEPRLWKHGDIVEMIDLSQFGPLEVPLPERWYVLKVFANLEAKVMRTFEQRNISAYLPTIVTVQVVTKVHYGYQSEHKRSVTCPLFPGLIFIPDFQARERRVLDVEGVHQYFRMDQCVPYLRPELMRDIRQLAAIGSVPASQRKRMFAVGELVRVTRGPFRSFNGVIDRLDSNGRLSVLVDIFKRMTPTELDESQIEPV